MRDGPFGGGRLVSYCSCEYRENDERRTGAGGGVARAGTGTGFVELNAASGIGGDCHSSLLYEDGGRGRLCM